MSVLPSEEDVEALSKGEEFTKKRRQKKTGEKCYTVMKAILIRKASTVNILGAAMLKRPVHDTSISL